MQHAFQARWAVAGLLAFLAGAAPARAAPARNIILFVSDGAGYNAKLAADYYRHGQASNLLPLVCFASTYPLSTGGSPGSPANGSYDPALAWTPDFDYLPANAVDSAAAASALAAGVKTYNGAISWLNSDEPAPFLVTECARNLGKSVGLVTSDPWPRATPAAFGAHNPSRNNYAAISAEMLTNSLLDVLMGAGHPEYDNQGQVRGSPDHSYVGAAAWSALKAGTLGSPTPWTFIETREALEALTNGATPARVLGMPRVFQNLQETRAGAAAGEAVYEHAFLTNVPTLATLTLGALNVLDNHAAGFFLMVESAGTDYAGHAGHPARLIEEEIEFHRAIEAASRWVEAHGGWGETLVIVTSDHETGMLWGPDSGAGTPDPYAPIANNGVSNMPGMVFHSGGHANMLVPVYAAGTQAHLLAQAAVSNDPVYGIYLDNTDIYRAMLRAWDYLLPPAGLAATEGAYSNQVRVTWSASAGAWGYEVWRNTAPDSGGAAVAGLTADTSFDDTAVTPEQVYYYWVCATNAGGASAYSALASGYAHVEPPPEEPPEPPPPTPPAAPTGVEASDGAYSNQVRVTWSASAGAWGYEVWRSTAPDSGSAAAAGLTADTSFNDTAVTPEQVYYYWVRATNAGGASAYSALACGYAHVAAAPEEPPVPPAPPPPDPPAPPEPPPAPAGAEASDGTYGDRVRVTWPGAAGADTYALWRAGTGETAVASLVVEGLTDLAYDDASVIVGRRYIYAVQACNAQGTSAMGAGDVGWARSLAAGGRLGNDYDGDGACDLAVLDHLGRWYILSLSGNVVAWSLPWGWTGASPAPGDYDGDGRADLAVFDPEAGRWYIARLDGSVLVWAESWGGAGTRVSAGDFDGNGAADMTGLDAAGCWHIRTLSGGILAWSESWGWPGAAPVAGDYDGDGASDLAVFDGRSGSWYIRTLGGDWVAWALPWGWPGAAPVAGDYDGDGASDLAVFDGRSGNWYIRALVGDLVAWALPWGWPGAIPVAGDYDGDGASDLAVYDAGVGAWYIRTVSGGLLAWALPWGGPGMMPARGLP